MKTTATTSKLTNDAMTLFGVKDEQGVRNCLFALKLRETCSRCGGSGRYSYNQIDGDRCFGCNGARERAAKLTKAVLEAARIKVEAGELATLRAANRARMAAKKEIAPLVEKAKAVYDTIGQAYEAAYTRPRAAAYAGEGDRSWDRIPESLHRAQEMNNSLFFGGHSVVVARTSVSSIESDVRTGKRRDYVAAKAEMEAVIGMLETLRAAWLAFAA